MSLRARLRYRSDEFLSGGAGRQLLFLFALTMLLVLVFAVLAAILGLDTAQTGESFLDRAWFYFTRLIDAGTMGADAGTGMRVVSTTATILGVIVAGLLISSLAGNFQERLDAIRRGGSPVIERGHFLVLGWSEKIFSVIDQLAEAYVGEGRICVVVMAEREKIEMEERLREKLEHLGRIKLVVRSGSSVSLLDLSRVSFAEARAVVVLVDERDIERPTEADGRVIKTLMALFNHPDARGRATHPRVTAEVIEEASQPIALIAADGRAEVVKTNEIISKVLLQTSRISGLSLVYDELFRFEGNEIHFKRFPEVTGRTYDEVVLDVPNGCVVGVAKSDGSGHTLNPPRGYVIGPDEELLILAEDPAIQYARYAGAVDPTRMPPAAPPGAKPVEHLLVLGWNEKVFPILSEFDSYVGPGSSMTLVNRRPVEERNAALVERVGALENVELRHVVGEFTSPALMDELAPERYPTVMVLGDAADGDTGVEAADTRAIIALLLLRDRRRRAGVPRQEVCSEILDPRNRELAATTEIHDIVISNQLVSMVLAQITFEPRVRPVLEDLLRSEGSEIYLKPLSLYARPGDSVTFEQLIVAARGRGESALGVQQTVEDASQRYGIALNPRDRRAPFQVRAEDRLIVLAEDDN